MKNDHLVKLRSTVWEVLTIGLLFVGLWACTTQAGPKSEKEGEPTVSIPGTPVDAVVLKPSEVSEAIDINATLVANQEVQIVSEMTRKIVSVPVREGSTVKKGTLLFKLDNADLQAQLEKFRQQEKLTVLNEQRLKDLLAHDAVAQQDYDDASTQLKVLQAQIQELLVAIDKTNITAPFDGQIGMINVHPGSIVSTNTILTNIEDNRLIKVEFSVPEKYAALVSTGTEIIFTTAATNKTYKAKIAAVGGRLNENTRSLLVRAITPNVDGDLFPGQSARVSLKFNSSSDALSVSANALMASSTGYTLFVAHDGIARAVPVQIGQRNASSVQIVSGLQKGDTVITSNLLRLAPGTPISFASIK
ncbi:MAG TPA: efflux RND transporter periplasmic adaptor subunit [Ohtaekwangia sp.]|nr:efflux RND transporter periplasmic adaptor subunit [Ohtaekwangia sp.]